MRSVQGSVSRGGKTGCDRFRLGVWIGKTSRGDDHLIFDGDEVRKCRTVKRRLEYLRSHRVRVDAKEAHPQRPRPPRERIPRDRPKRYITWAYIKKYGGTPNCKACAVDGPSHSKECRERFEAIFQKGDDEKAMKEAADAAATSAALQDEEVKKFKGEAPGSTQTEKGEQDTEACAERSRPSQRSITAGGPQRAGGRPKTHRRSQAELPMRFGLESKENGWSRT